MARLDHHRLGPAQVFYNLEFSRYVLATGEVPIVGFGRIPPGPG